MLSLAVRIGRHLQQQAFEGGDRKHSLYCTSCVFSNTIGYVQQNQRGRYGSGWFNHTRSSYNWKSSCKLKEDRELCQLSDRELKDHLIEVGLLGEKEAEKLREKRKAEEMKKASKARSSGNEPRSVSVSQSEEPDRKKQKKEKKEEERRKKAEAEAEARKKEEDASKKKEAEDFRAQLQSELDIILHGYLFDETFRCETQKSLMKQAEYEKKLVFSVLERMPNYRSRVQEGEDMIMNRREIEMHNERMREAEREKERERERERILCRTQPKLRKSKAG